jgi:thiamine-phosphate pyrophosphorylase
MTSPAPLRERLSVIVISDPDCGEGRDLVEVVRAGLAGGAPMIQLRAKEASAREMAGLARRLLAETRAAGALFLVNDRVDVALAVGADGAHIGADDLPLEAARAIVPRGFLLGRSVDSAAEAAAAARAGADYLGVGPVFATGSKSDAGPVVGLEGVRAACEAAGGVPVVGIGGIDAGNAAAVGEAGAAGVAVISAVMRAPDPRAAVERLLEGVARGRGGA